MPRPIRRPVVRLRPAEKRLRPREIAQALEALLGPGLLTELHEAAKRKKESAA